jgi:hypothetical protein
MIPKLMYSKILSMVSQLVLHHMLDRVDRLPTFIVGVRSDIWWYSSLLMQHAPARKLFSRARNYSPCHTITNEEWHDIVAAFEKLQSAVGFNCADSNILELQMSDSIYTQSIQLSHNAQAAT